MKTAACLIFIFVTISCLDIDTKLPAIDLDQISDEPVELNFSSLVEDLEIIPLETCKECLINANPIFWLADDFVLVGTSPGGGNPGKVFRFDRTGKFLNEIGTAGAGPGEHTSSGKPLQIRFYQSDNSVMIYWGRLNYPQRFDPEGNFLDEVRLPFRGAYSLERLGQTEWVITGIDDWGKAKTRMDSTRTVFFTASGDVNAFIPRTNFPVLSRELEYMIMEPEPHSYFYGENLKFNLRGNDTLFTIADRHPVPDAVFSGTWKDIPLQWRVFAETDAYWFMRIAKAKNFSAEGLGGGATLIDFENTNLFVIVDKYSGQAQSVKLNDDVFFLFNHFTTSQKEFVPTRLQWQGDRVYFSVPAYEWLYLLQSADASKVSPEIKAKLSVLENMVDEDNPVIFCFALKDSITFYKTIY